MIFSYECINLGLHGVLDNFVNSPLSKKIVFILGGFGLLGVFRPVVLEPVFHFLQMMMNSSA
jgi:hypothetical protein